MTKVTIFIYFCIVFFLKKLNFASHNYVACILFFHWLAQFGVCRSGRIAVLLLWIPSAENVPINR
jgi:hypothetical protein